MSMRQTGSINRLYLLGMFNAKISFSSWIFLSVCIPVDVKLTTDAFLRACIKSSEHANEPALALAAIRDTKFSAEPK